MTMQLRNLRQYCRLLAALGALHVSVSTWAADETVTGNLTVTGNTSVGGVLTTTGAANVGGHLVIAGGVDAAGNDLTLGDQGGTFGLGAFFLPAGPDGVRWQLTRVSAWLWEVNNGGTVSPSMRLDAANRLLLYSGGTAGVTLDPATRSLSLGDAVLYRDASGALKTDGALTVGGTFTATIGSLSGGSNGLALNAGGTNQSITLTPSGSGATLFNGNVGIGTTSPSSAKLVVASPQATGNNTVIAEFTKSGGVNTYGSAILRLSRGVGGESMDAELNSGGSGPFRYGTYSDSLFVNNQNATNGPYGSIHFVTNLAPRLTIGGGTLAGNVGIGTTSPSAKLEIAGPAARVIVRNGSEDISATFPERLSLYARSTGPDTEANEYGPKISFRTLWGGTENEVAYIAGFNDYAWKAGMAFGVKPQGNGQLPVPVMTIRESGNVGIGTTTPTHKLAVNGTIKAKEVLIDSTGWADYVFAEDYRLAPLAEVEQHIREKKHLPGIPSAAEVATQGVSLGDMQAKLLSKIEELTLHLIRLEQENGSLRERVQKLEAKALPLP